jgi:hypothetical protein
MFMVLLTACSVENDELNPSESAATVTEDVNYAIAVALYTDQWIPDDFYHNEMLDDTAFYVTYHVKNTDLVPVYDRTGMAVYELSTDDYSQALDWANTAAVYRPVYKSIVDHTETDLYFQFFRVDAANRLIVDLVRVFKRRALDRTGVDRTKPEESYQGTIKPDVLSPDFTKTVDEYLWSFTIANNYGTFIISSEITEYVSAYIHSLLEARLEWESEDTCDRISIYELVYQIDKDTGDIHKEEHFVRQFFARRADVGYEICHT